MGIIYCKYTIKRWWMVVVFSESGSQGQTELQRSVSRNSIEWTAWKTSDRSVIRIVTVRRVLQRFWSDKMRNIKKYNGKLKRWDQEVLKFHVVVHVQQIAVEFKKNRWFSYVRWYSMCHGFSLVSVGSFIVCVRTKLILPPCVICIGM